MKILYRQYSLENGNNHLTAWLDAIHLLVGFKVQLRDSEDPELWWKVTGRGDTTLPKDEIKGSHNSAKWHKNDYHGRIKGLKLS